MVLNLKKFRISSWGTEDYTIDKIVKLQKKIGFNFPPDFLYLNINIGCVISNGNEKPIIKDYNFSRTITFEDYANNPEDMALYEKYNSQFLIFGYTDANQVFLVMGKTQENLNQIFILNDNFGDPPEKVSDNIFSFFNYDLN